MILVHDLKLPEAAFSWTCGELRAPNGVFLSHGARSLTQDPRRALKEETPRANKARSPRLKIGNQMSQLVSQLSASWGYHPVATMKPRGVEVSLLSVPSPGFRLVCPTKLEHISRRGLESDRKSPRSTPKGYLWISSTERRTSRS